MSQTKLDTPLTAPQRMAAHTLAFAGWAKGKAIPRGAASLAAQRANVTRQSIYLWLKIPAFVEAIEHQQAEVVSRAWETLTKALDSGSITAATELIDRITLGGPPRLRIAAALEQIKHKNRMKEFQARLALENAEFEVGFELPDFQKKSH